MGFVCFEDIEVWHKSKELTIDIYRYFELSKDFGFRDQIRRAAVSVMNNLAEGYERQTNKEFRQFLFVARGSCSEVKSMLYLALELSIIDHDQYERLISQTVEISKMLSGLIRSMKV
jgi:four helix bundle protein